MSRFQIGPAALLVPEHAGCEVEVSTTDKLTDAQIVAKVKEHFGIER